MMPLKSYGHYGEYESYLTFFFIIMLKEDQFHCPRSFYSYEAYNVLTYLANAKSQCDLCVNA